MNPFESLKHAIRTMVSLAVVVASKNRSAEVSMAAGERHSDMRIAQPYGVSARCPNGRACLVLFNGDSHSSGSIVGYFDDAAPDVDDGEVCFYSKFGQRLLFKKDGSIVATPKNGVMKVEGELQVTHEVTANFGVAPVKLSTHIHGTGVGPSTPPQVGT